MNVNCEWCDAEFDDESRGDDPTGACSDECREHLLAFNAEAEAHGMSPLLYAAHKIIERGKEAGITDRDTRREINADPRLLSFIAAVEGNTESN